MYLPLLSKSHSHSGRLRRRQSEEVEVPLSGDSLGKSDPNAYGYGHGGGNSTIIPEGHPFAGRSVGGGTRDQIFGTKAYGSGYPGIEGRGVVGRPLPFWYWPVVWSRNASSIQPYLDGSEYGESSNTTRFGGPLMEALFISNLEKLKTKFCVISDQSTVDYLVQTVSYNCSDYLSSLGTSSPFDADSQHAPKPQQAIQYYRASSTVLTLDGYNNSATFSGNGSVSDSPLPQNIDTKLLECLNQTIGSAVPLVDGAPETWTMQHWWIGLILAFSPVLVVVAAASVVAAVGVLFGIFFGIVWVTVFAARNLYFLCSEMKRRATSFVLDHLSGMTRMVHMDTIHGTTGPQVNDWSNVEG